MVNDTDLKTGAVVVSVPVVAMMIGSALAVVYRPGELLRCVCSSIAAGVLVCAVALELLPRLVEPQTSWYSGPSGFAVGICFFSFLAWALPDPDDEDEEDDEDEVVDGANEKTPLLSVDRNNTDGDTRARAASPPPAIQNPAFDSTSPTTHVVSVCQGTSCSNRGSEFVATDIEDLVAGTPDVSVSKPHVCMNHGKCSDGPVMKVESTGPQREKSVMSFTAVTAKSARQLLAERYNIRAREPSRGLNIASMEQAALASQNSGKSGLPWTRLIVVTLDGMMDGLTLGIANAIGVKEAALIATAMTIEMCFVGVSLSCALRPFKIPFVAKLAIVLTVPLGMYVGFIIGAFALQGVDEQSDIFIGVIGFAAAALLYLALVELIPESFAIAEEIGTQFPDTVLSSAMFTGFTLVLVLENFSAELEN